MIARPASKIPDSRMRAEATSRSRRIHPRREFWPAPNGADLTARRPRTTNVWRHSRWECVNAREFLRSRDDKLIAKQARWGDAVPASRIRPRWRHGRLRSSDAATTRRTVEWPRHSLQDTHGCGARQYLAAHGQPVVAGLVPLDCSDNKGFDPAKPIRRGLPGVPSRSRRRRLDDCAPPPRLTFVLEGAA